jgi:ATP-binding protein involved in chromosome partitioning
MDLFGVGGGALVAGAISKVLGTDVPVLGQIPFDVALREGGDNGQPLVISNPTAPASVALREIAEKLGKRPRGLAGLSLGITPAGR